MTKPTYATLMNAVEHIIHVARPLASQPNGQHYFFGRLDANKYLVELKVLGQRQQFPGNQIYPDYNKHNLKYVWPVNYKRLEQVWDKLLNIAKKEGVPEEKYRRKDFGYVNSNTKLGKLRVDLEKLK